MWAGERPFSQEAFDSPSGELAWKTIPSWQSVWSWTMSPVGPPPRALALYEALLATQSELERKGATTLYTSVNGNMFSFLSPEGAVAIRLGKADREAFIETYATGLHEAHGRVMKEYVTVPDELLANTDELAASFAKSYEYAQQLKPKATTRKPRASTT